MRMDGREFLSRLADEYYDRLYKYALVLTRSAEDARELTQETFLTAASAMPEDGPGIYGWMRTTLYHHFLHWRDRRDRERYYTQPPDADDAAARLADPRDETGDRLADLDMRRLLTGEEYRLMRRVYFEGYSEAEAARELGITAAACRKRVQRARERLRKKYME